MFYSIFSVVTILAVLAVFVFYFFVKKKDGKDWIYAIYFLTIMVSGTVLFSLGLYYKNDAETTFSPLFVIARALTCSLKTLGGEIQVGTMSKLAQDYPIVAVATFVHFIAAAMLTFLIVIKLFGKNLINRLRVFLNTLRPKYIVVGASGQADVFLNSLDADKRRRTTVVLETRHKDCKKELMFRGFAVVVMRAVEGASSDVAAQMREALAAAGYHKCTHNTKIVAMSDSDEVNLLVAKVVTDFIAAIVAPSKNRKGRINKLNEEQERLLGGINLWSYIMYRELERAEHFSFSEYALGRVRFFNPYEVQARKFALENPITSLIPRSWINTQKARLFNASDEGRDRSYRIGNIFVGYGYTNQQLLKKSVCDCQMLGCDYNAVVIDKDARRLQGQFQNSACGLFDATNADGRVVRGAELEDSGDYYPSDESYNITFVDANVLSADCYNRVAAELSGERALDFATVVIALGSDKLSIETALELRQKLYERRLLKAGSGDEQYDRVRIFVKIKEQSVLSDHSLLNDKNDIDSEIVTFGATNEVLSEDYIIYEKLDDIAKRIANDYWHNAGEDGQKTNLVSKWDSLTEFKRDSNRYAAMAIRTKLNLLGFELSEGGQTEDATWTAVGEAYGIATANAQRAAKKSGFVDFVERNDDGSIVDNARNNLARLEHRRWNAMHLASGWTKLAISEVSADSRQDERSKQHACITTFEGLTALRERQASLAVLEARDRGDDLPFEQALANADTVCYDFDVMDRLHLTLADSNLRITPRETD